VHSSSEEARETGAATGDEPPESDPATVAEGEPEYDEAQWQNSFDEAEATGISSDEPAIPQEMEDQPLQTGPVPSLEELIARIPPRNHELVEGLFRGRFVDVRPLDRRKLY
jgi:hypothetical protein